MYKPTKVTIKGKVWTKTDIQHLIKTNNAAAVKALYRIYDKQTQDEQYELRMH